MSFMLHVPLDSIIESVIAVGGVSLWVSSVSLGYPIMTIPVWDKFGHKSGPIFHFKHNKLWENPDTQEDLSQQR